MNAPIVARQSNKSLATLFADLWRESANLLREEAALAGTELTGRIAAAGSGLLVLAIGAAIFLAGLLLLLFAIVAGVALMLPEEHATWLAPTIVGIAVIVPGAVLLIIGKSRLQAEQFKPRRVARSIRRDADLVKEHIS